MSTMSQDEPVTWRPGRIEPAPQPGRPSQPSAEKITVRAAAICLLLSVVFGAIAYVVGQALPSTYQSSGLIRVAVPSQQGAIDPVVTAANDIASQYAQLASSAPVAARAATGLGVSANSLNGKITGGTVSGQNLVQVTASAHSARTASARAAAASAALTGYITALNTQAAARYVSGVTGGLTTINRSLGQLTIQLRHDKAPARAADRGALQSLSSQRDQLLGQVARDAASNEPSLQVVNASTGATLTSPKPKLYALVAFIVALLLTGRAAFVLSGRRGA
jgi:hypothetical protein